MAERIKFYMDEHVPRAVTEGLRRRGVDVLTTQEAAMLEADDEQHVALALREGRGYSPFRWCRNGRCRPRPGGGAS
jgi:hypothetical protein